MKPKYIGRTMLTLLLLFTLPLCSLAGDYEKAWEALLKNDKEKARTLLLKAIKNNDNRNSAIATLLLFETNEGRGHKVIKDYNNPARQITEPDAYWYALWFNEAVLGDYGRKDDAHLENINYAMTNAAFNGSMHSAGHYFQSMHEYYSMQQEKAIPHYEKMGALENWQYVGPFDNINGSGFSKEYGPVKEVNKGKGFLSFNNTQIDWFTPKFTNRQGWVFVGAMFPATTAIGYMQTFVHSAEEKDALVCLGGAGAFKLWINDKELIAEPNEKITELDFYKVRCHLKKGYNRILVQIGYTADIQSPNFIVRLTDDQYNTLPGITSTDEVKPYMKDNSTTAPVAIPHFAETYFRQLMEKKPQDPVNPILLANVYIRNQEHDKAREVMSPLLKRYPDHAFILSQYINGLSTKRHYTEVMEKIETLKQLDKDNYWVMSLEVTRLEEEKKYAEALEQVNRLIAKVGETQENMQQRINNMGRLEKLDSMLILLKDAYARYPDNEAFASMTYYVEKNLNRDPAAALAVMEKFCSRKFHYNMLKSLAAEYLQQGQHDKGEEIYRTMLSYVDYDRGPYEEVSGYFFGRQKYDSAIHYLERLHSISPYYHKALGDIGYSYLQQNRNDKAKEYFTKALALHSGMYAYRKQIRTLEGKPDIFGLFPATDEYTRINAALKEPKDTAHSFYYIFDEKNVVLYPDGANEREVYTALYIRNNSGIDNWKEISLPYNDVYETVTIIKAEVIKANGSKVPGEIYNNQVVFTKLEPGDAVFYHYKVSSYGIGRLGKEFWDKFYFSAHVPTEGARYSILAAKALPLHYELVNNDKLKPKVTDKGEFKLYTWELKNIAAYKQESYMPSLNDFGEVLHLSTVKDWNVIAEWYSDITRMQSRDEFDVNVAYAEIFPQGADKLDDWEKARRIYDYIEANIVYSSVSFRQGAYVPQRASKTLVTRLGDCKDMSALFLAFAHKAGLDANLVLVNTRDNGNRGLRLPSMEFNHCIVRFKAGNAHHYLELTDKYLPFGVLPQSVRLAQMLNIPYRFNGANEQLQQVSPAGNSSATALVRRINVKVNKSDVEVKTNSASTGTLSAYLRGRFRNNTPDENKQSVQKQVAAYYKNHVELDKFSFRNLDKLTDSVHQEVSYTVKNEVVNVGDFSMLRPSFMEQVASQDIFTSEARMHPFEYWEYENVDKYVTEVDIELPEGKAFNQVPESLKTSFSWMTYSISYEKLSPGKLRIRREFNTDTNKNISTESFTGMKDFFNKILETEQKYISFK